MSQFQMDGQFRISKLSGWPKLDGQNWMAKIGWPKLDGQIWMAKIGWPKLDGQNWMAKLDCQKSTWPNSCG